MLEQARFCFRVSEVQVSKTDRTPNLIPYIKIHSPDTQSWSSIGLPLLRTLLMFLWNKTSAPDSPDGTTLHRALCICRYSDQQQGWALIQENKSSFNPMCHWAFLYDAKSCFLLHNILKTKPSFCCSTEEHANHINSLCLSFFFFFCFPHHSVLFFKKSSLVGLKYNFSSR